MLPQFNSQSDSPAYQSLKWMFLLRTFSIAGETVLILFTVYVVHYPIPEDPLWAILSVIIIVNSLTWHRLQDDDPNITEWELFGQLTFDVLGITAMLYLTGGATNPITWFFLLPLIVTATILPQRYSWYMVVLTSACYTLLIRFYRPLPELHSGHNMDDIPQEILDLQPEFDFNLHIFAMWFCYLLIASIVAHFIVEMSTSIRERDQRLSKAREQALRNERVVALGTLAAGAAHEMGTPLGTMAILVHELEQESAEQGDDELHEKMHIIREQIRRCNKALSVLSASAGQTRAESGSIMTVDKYIAKVIRQWRTQRVDVALQQQISSAKPTPSIIAERTLTHALINILDNAADVSPASIELDAEWNEKQLTLEIRDQGPGIEPDIAAAVGKAPLASIKEGPDQQHGLGIGLFLTHATIERLGGQIEFFNRDSGGTCTRIRLPLLTPTQVEP